MSIKTINPANGEVLATYPLMGTEEIKETVESANRAFQQWRSTVFS
jgi:acyl-CoA reductase-like NAD-dependent aldehyde dehydrogenase